MSDLLTADEYRAIAETMSFGGNAFIDGIARPAASGDTFPTLNPATGAELARVAAVRRQAFWDNLRRERRTALAHLG